MPNLEREVTLLKNQMKSAMMAKPADKMVQSGNSRVKVTLYGQINRAVRFASTQNRPELQSIDNNGGSRIGVSVVGSLNPNLTGVANIELIPGRTAATRETSNSGRGHYRNPPFQRCADPQGYGHDFAGPRQAYGANAWRELLRHGPCVRDLGTPATVSRRPLARTSATGLDTWSATVVGTALEPHLRYRTPNLMGAAFEASYNDDNSWSAGF